MWVSWTDTAVFNLMNQLNFVLLPPPFLNDNLTPPRHRDSRFHPSFVW